MMKSLVVVASVLLLAACGNNSSTTGASSESSGASSQTASTEAAVVGNWKMIPELSRITFTSTQVGKSFMGEFKRFSTVIRLDPNNLADAHIEVTIDMSSADAHDEQRNLALAGEEWFDVAHFPTAVFRSDSVKKLEDGTYQAAGKLTIRNITMDLVVPFTLDIDGDMARAFGEFNLMRTDYKLGDAYDDSSAGVKVLVTFDVTATRVPS